MGDTAGVVGSGAAAGVGVSLPLPAGLAVSTGAVASLVESAPVTGGGWTTGPAADCHGLSTTATAAPATTSTPPTSAATRRPPPTFCLASRMAPGIGLTSLVSDSRCLTTGLGLGGSVVSRPLAPASNASANALQVANRSSGCLASDFSTTVTSAGGRLGRSTSSGGTGSMQCCRTMSISDSPVNGRWPPSIWYAITPSEYWSAAGPTFLPEHCSGLM